MRDTDLVNELLHEADTGPQMKTGLLLAAIDEIKRLREALRYCAQPKVELNTGKMLVASQGVARAVLECSDK